MLIIFSISMFLTIVVKEHVSTKRRMNLYEIADQNLCVSFGPDELLDAPGARLEKLFKRFLALSPNDDFSNIPDGTKVEYGHLVEVRNPLYSEKPFETITGPFKNVDSRTLLDQIHVSKPERRIHLQYHSGRKGHLLTLTRLLKISEEEVSNRGRKSVQDLEERAKRYKRKKLKIPSASEKLNAVVDDDIGDLISKFGDAALEETGGSINVNKSINVMVDKWHVQETEAKVMVYESDSESSLSPIVEDLKQAKNKMKEEKNEHRRQTCWERFKTACCCCCSRFMPEVHGPVSMDVPRFAIKRRLRDGKGSERLWQPHRRKCIHVEKLPTLQVSRRGKDLLRAK